MNVLRYIFINRLARVETWNRSTLILSDPSGRTSVNQVQILQLETNNKRYSFTRDGPILTGYLHRLMVILGKGLASSFLTPDHPYPLQKLRKFGSILVLQLVILFVTWQNREIYTSGY